MTTGGQQCGFRSITGSFFPSRAREIKNYYYDYYPLVQTVSNQEPLFNSQTVSDGAAKTAATTGGKLGARSVVARIVDFASSRGVSLPKRYRGHLAKQVGELMEEGYSGELVYAAGQLLILRNLDPSLMSSCVVTAQVHPYDEQKEADTGLLRRHLEERGGEWPTGSRWVKGTHSATYVKDVLGYDRPSYAVPWSRPTRAEVIRALRDREDEVERGPDPPDVGGDQ